MSEQPPVDLTNPRNLSGVYFRLEIDGKWKNICFEELPRTKQIEILKEKGESREWLDSVILHLADTLVELGNFTNVAK